MPLENDAFVAEIALRDGLLDVGQLRRALEIQWAAATVGMDENLLDVLRTKGILSERDALELEDELTLSALKDRPEQIDGYRILQPLGQSGLAALFLAAETATGAEVVLRVLSPRLAREGAVAERFTAHAKALCSLKHVNVERGLVGGRSGEYRYCVLELVEGQSLADGLGGGPLAVRAAVAAARLAAAGLGHMHARGIVHGDVRPGNIYATDDGRVKLTWPGRIHPPREAGLPLATPYYMPPEVARGSLPTDPRSDIYSLGATLYHVLTGRPVVQAESVRAACQRQIEMAPTPPASVRADIPRPLNDLILRMLAKSPSERPRSAEEVGQQLAAMASGRALVRPPPPPQLSSATPPPLAAQAPAARTRRPLGVVWASIVMLLLGGLAVAVAWAVRRQTTPIVKKQRASTRRKRRKPKDVKPRTPEPAPVPAKPREPDEATRRLVEEAVALSQSEPADHERVLLALRRAALALGPDPTSAQVAARIVARRSDMNQRAKMAYDGLSVRVQALREGDKFGDALQACAAFPRELRCGVWGERVDARAMNLGTQAEQRCLELAMLGLAALRRERLDDGLAAYARIEGLGIPWIAEAGKGLHAAAATYAATERKRIETAAAARTQVAARKLPGKLTSAFAKIAALARERRFGEGVKLLAQVPKSAAQGSNAGAVARMQAKLQRLAGFWEAIQAGPPGAVGMELSAYGQKGKIARFDEPSRRVYVRLASSGRTVPIAINQLTDAQVAAIARRAGPPAEAAGWQLNAALYLLARGNEAEGREALLAAQKAGADVAEALAEQVAATAVAKALDGAEQGKANAVNLLTAALEAHPGSQAVILRHRKLMAELKRLGGISSIVAVKGGPLPDELLRLKLLPKTRISVTPPANVAAAALASPLERGSPVVLGLASWTDYSLSLRWTVEEPADLLVFFRLGEPAAGGFSCGALSVQAGRLELGQLTAGVYRPAAAVQAPDLSQRVSHRARITVQGSTVVVTVDDGSPLRMTLRQLTKGNVGIAVSRGTIFIHDVEVAFPLQAPSPRTTP